jgi:diketogulonate reductase-like aldo/keto reductase
MLKNINRREFLHTAAGLGIVSLVPGCSDNQMDQAGQSANPASPPVRIPGRLIPGTNESLPMVGFGSTAAVREIPEKGTDEMRRIIRTLVDNGASVIDTSIRVEEIDRPFGQILQDPEWKDRLFIAQKINTLGKEAGLEQIRQTERFFGRRPADLIQVESMIDTDNHLDTLREWKAGGGTRYIGITTSNSRDHGRMETYMRKGGLDFIQVNYSIPEYQAEERVLPLARDLGIAVLINSPFNGGQWFRLTAGKPLPGWAADIGATSWAQVNLKFILSNPAVNCVLTETTDPNHLIENIRSSLGEMPDETLHRRMKDDVLSMI